MERDGGKDKHLFKFNLDGFPQRVVEGREVFASLLTGDKAAPGRSLQSPKDDQQRF